MCVKNFFKWPSFLIVLLSSGYSCYRSQVSVEDLANQNKNLSVDQSTKNETLSKKDDSYLSDKVNSSIANVEQHQKLLSPNKDVQSTHDLLDHTLFNTIDDGIRHRYVDNLHEPNKETKPFDLIEQPINDQGSIDNQGPYNIYHIKQAEGYSAAENNVDVDEHYTVLDNRSRMNRHIGDVHQKNLGGRHVIPLLPDNSVRLGRSHHINSLEDKTTKNGSPMTEAQSLDRRTRNDCLGGMDKNEKRFESRIHIKPVHQDNIFKSKNGVKFGEEENIPVSSKKEERKFRLHPKMRIRHKSMLDKDKVLSSDMKEENDAHHKKLFCRSKSLDRHNLKRHTVGRIDKFHCEKSILPIANNFAKNSIKPSCK